MSMPDPIQPERLGLVARMLLRHADRAALGTILTGQARPYVSLVGLATDIDGTPVLLLSRLAEHTRAILKNPHVSLLVDGTAGFVNPQQGPRITLLGRVDADCDERLGRRFLARHPAAALYAGFADFSFYRFSVERIHWVGGFGRAQWLTPQPACDGETARRFDAALNDVRAAIEERHAEALARIARTRLGKRGKKWHLASIDPDGCDLLLGAKGAYRLSFDQPLASPDDVIATLLEFLGSI
jgi:hypothetical protein